MIFDPVATHGRARAGATALVELESGRRWTWAGFDDDVNRTANWLIERLGAASGARVAVVARNCAEMLPLQFGCVRAGAIFVPMNWRLAAPEIAALLADAEPALLLHDGDFDITGFRGPAQDMAALTGMIAAHPATPPPPSARRAWDETATILYTSGTSGRSKGVMVSEANAFWGSTNFILGNGVSSASIFLCDMPLFHTAGLFANARTPIQAGATLLLSRGFDPALTLARLADPALGVTHYFSVPQMARTMAAQPGFTPQMLRGLHVYAMGGAPNPPAQIARFVSAGIAMSDGFGMSETCSNFGMPVGDRALLLEKAGTTSVWKTSKRIVWRGWRSSRCPRSSSPISCRAPLRARCSALSCGNRTRCSPERVTGGLRYTYERGATISGATFIGSLLPATCRGLRRGSKQPREEGSDGIATRKWAP